MVGHKTNLSKFKKAEIISTISDYNGVKLEIKKKAGKSINMWKPNNTLQINEWVKWEIKRKN